MTTDEVTRTTRVRPLFRPWRVFEVRTVRVTGGDAPWRVETNAWQRHRPLVGEDAAWARRTHLSMIAVTLLGRRVYMGFMAVTDVLLSPVTMMVIPREALLTWSLWFRHRARWELMWTLFVRNMIALVFWTWVVFGTSPMFALVNGVLMTAAVFAIWRRTLWAAAGEAMTLGSPYDSPGDGDEGEAGSEGAAP